MVPQEKTELPKPHIHDSFQCFPHVRRCACTPQFTYICNPYYVADHCPLFFEDELEAEENDKEHCGWLVIPMIDGAVGT